MDDEKRDTFTPGVTTSAAQDKQREEGAKADSAAKREAAKQVKRPRQGDQVAVLIGGVTRMGTVESVTDDPINKSVAVDVTVPGPTQVVKGIGYLQPGAKSGWSWP